MLHVQTKLRARHIAQSLFVIASLGVWSSLPAGCSSSPPPAPQQAQPSAPARDLRLYLRLDTPGAGTPVIGGAFDAFGNALTQAGYQVVGDEKKADVIAALKIVAVQENSLIKVTVNGQTSQKFTVSVMASFLSSDRSTLDTVSGSYSTGDDGAAQEESTAMVGRLNASPKLSQHALQLKSDRTARDQKAREEAEAEAYRQEQEKLAKERAAKQKEEDTWKTANPAGCRSPQALNACEAVKGYLKSYPTGVHAEQAKQTIQEAEPKLAALQIEQDWAKVDLAACKAPKHSTDCDQAKAHVDRFPDSPHATEARDALKKVETKLAALARQEEATEKQRQAREAAEQKRQEQLECQTDCKKNVCSAWALSAKFGLCVSRCIQNTCSN